MVQTEPVAIGDRLVGPDQRVFVTAEAGVNHNGGRALAEELVDAAAEAGADAVKFQTFAAELVASASAPPAAYQRRAGSATQRDLLRGLELDAESFSALAARCRTAGILFLSSPFDLPSVDLLAGIGVDAFKLGSGELTNFPLVEYVARQGRPVILSTGMAFLDEVREAVKRVQAAGASAIVLHCVSSYPADPAEANLRALLTMREELGVPVGYSDHTVGNETALAAVALGACMLEKHLTLDRTLPGPDHAASLEPAELRDLVRGIRAVEAALGDGVKRPARSELSNRDLVRRSLHAARDIPAGTALTADALVSLRPGGGIAPRELDRLVGRIVSRAIAAGAALTWDDLT